MISKWRGHSKKNARYQGIPERVLNAISAQQEASEKLVGWVQMAVVIFFGLLYAVSPKTFSRDMTFEPVPWFLGIWLVVTIMRLYLAYRYRMSAPLLYLSIIIDMSLLLGMIWSFHLQYQQPPSFYLKSPTLLYVFIFIALRALRFEARYVITAGVVAATGWAAMAVYATLASGGMDVVTRDYVYYLTSNRVLKGAELDKVITILTVTAIIAVAITRAHKLLIKAAAEGAAAHDLSRFFSPEIARQITTAEQEITAGTGQARDAVNLAAKLEKHTKSEGVRALCTQAAFDIAIRQGYQMSVNRERRKARGIEGVDNPVDIIILVP